MSLVKVFLNRCLIAISLIGLRLILFIILIQKSVCPVVRQDRLILQLVGKKLAVGDGFLLALGFELRHLFRRIVVLSENSGEHILKGFQSLFVHHMLRYFSAATPDFIQASTSLILNFHSLPIFVAGISLFSIHAKTVSRLTPRYSQISFIEHQRSTFKSIFRPHFRVDIKPQHNYTADREENQCFLPIYRE